MLYAKRIYEMIDENLFITQMGENCIGFVLDENRGLWVEG